MYEVLIKEKDNYYEMEYSFKNYIDASSFINTVLKHGKNVTAKITYVKGEE